MAVFFTAVSLAPNLTPDKVAEFGHFLPFLPNSSSQEFPLSLLLKFGDWQDNTSNIYYLLTAFYVPSICPSLYMYVPFHLFLKQPYKIGSL